MQIKKNTFVTSEDLPEFSIDANKSESSHQIQTLDTSFQQVNSVCFFNAF